jgi:hypothetical protein
VLFFLGENGLVRFAGILALLFSGLRAPLFKTLTPAQTGISFRHDNAKSDRRYLPESMGPGVAIFDFDNDGWMDLYFTNSGPADFFQPAKPLRNALYRNNHDGTFIDVTLKAGVAGRDFGIGVTTCDYNNDGWTDLFVTNYGTNILYKNNGDSTFTDVTAQAGLALHGLWTAAVFFDMDNDGDEDLFVGHFVEYNKQLERDCTQKGVPHYCYPLTYDPFPSRMYRNNGNGSFTDISASSGIGREKGKTFGAVATDINNDGLLDLFVANDSVPNFLFINRGNGKFEETGLDAGVAYNSDGAARSGMGVDAGDFDNDGWEDLFVANFNREKFSIYRNRGDGTFSDEAGPSGIGMATHMYSGWGLRFFDFDLDGTLDLIVCNGHPDDLIETLSSTLTYKEPVLLFRNEGTKFSKLNPSEAGEAFAGMYPARGLAVGDLNNDGYPDIVIANSGEAPLVLQHNAATANRSIGIAGLKPGWRITWTAGGQTRSRLKNAGGSYLSADDPRMLLGIGVAASASIEIVKPSGGEPLRFENLRAGRYYTLSKDGKLQ